eukprot:TRINITY_DN16210_c0_g1_i3.p3 TRINITY_DN16210_c0_g1~~TRINITY_DN16210_c0_g1_i3.p3  ORF type:complete len:102 (-),score=4.75 TRINITY_DN16210_c0_g1_i3:336-641(-)
MRSAQQSLCNQFQRWHQIAIHEDGIDDQSCPENEQGANSLVKQQEGNHCCQHYGKALREILHDAVCVLDDCRNQDPTCATKQYGLYVCGIVFCSTRQILTI